MAVLSFHYYLLCEPLSFDLHGYGFFFFFDETAWLWVFLCLLQGPAAVNYIIHMCYASLYPVSPVLCQLLCGSPLSLYVALIYCLASCSWLLSFFTLLYWHSYKLCCTYFLIYYICIFVSKPYLLVLDLAFLGLILCLS